MGSAYSHVWTSTWAAAVRHPEAWDRYLRWRIHCSTQIGWTATLRPFWHRLVRSSWPTDGHDSYNTSFGVRVDGRPWFVKYTQHPEALTDLESALRLHAVQHPAIVRRRLDPWRRGPAHRPRVGRRKCPFRHARRRAARAPGVGVQPFSGSADSRLQPLSEIAVACQRGTQAVPGP
jgi:hypothetical protein